MDTVNVPVVPTYVCDGEPEAGIFKPTVDSERETELAGTDTVRVVDVPPVLVVEVLVELLAPPLTMTLVIPLIAGGGVVVEPATVVPLG